MAHPPRLLGGVGPGRGVRAPSVALGQAAGLPRPLLNILAEPDGARCERCGRLRESFDLTELVNALACDAEERGDLGHAHEVFRHADHAT